jgi:hypothetical protein
MWINNVVVGQITKYLHWKLLGPFPFVILLTFHYKICNGAKNKWNSERMFSAFIELLFIQWWFTRIHSVQDDSSSGLLGIIQKEKQAIK